MSLEYIREYYGVPAMKGEPVEYEGKRGVVTGAHGPHVKVKLDGDKISKVYHPADLKWVNMEVQP